jgi:hypothetical protein
MSRIIHEYTRIPIVHHLWKSEKKTEKLRIIANERQIPESSPGAVLRAPVQKTAPGVG